MGENSKIEWCDHTFNPWIGCQKVSPGCDNCYAEAMMDHRYKKVEWGPHGERKRTSEQNWKKPVQWNAHARAFKKENRHRPRVFCASRWKRLKPIPAVIRFISYEPALGPLRLPSNGSLPDWLISGGESGAGARALRPQWVRDVIADCRRLGVAPFHKQWGTYDSNPLVAEKGMAAREAREIDAEGKGGGLVDGELVREFPDRN